LIDIILGEMKNVFVKKINEFYELVLSVLSNLT